MKRVGVISEKVATLVGLNGAVGSAIMLGDSNIAHMKSNHPNDYAKYGCDIELILSEPHYVGKNPKDGSIEYVREYVVNGEYVKVAVRISVSGTYFARSLYVLNRNRTQNFIKNGTLLRVY